MAITTTNGDEALERVVARLGELAGPDPGELFGRAIRQSIDEVLDGPRTGRWDFSQLEKTEKTYVGTKVEIVVRTSLGLERGPRFDLEIEGYGLDTKWAMGSVWQIPREAVNELCLCIGGLDQMTRFQVGVVRCAEEHLNAGENRDRKRTISALGRAAMHFLVEPSPLPGNFVAEMDPEIRAEVMAERTIQARVATLFRRVPYTAIPRGAVATVARTTGDPMRRLRQDTGANDPLQGMRILSAKYGKGIVEALGHAPLEANHFMAVSESDIEALPARVRRRLGLD
ncbi:MAG: NaeI family type II restriction endonuclease [Actinomycetota bacterium]|nr:hypothetical protein [Actinomycetota bacterium]